MNKYMEEPECFRLGFFHAKYSYLRLSLCYIYGCFIYIYIYIYTIDGEKLKECQHLVSRVV